jgi:hypothetical protein
MINWQYFPKSDKITDKLLETIEVFKINEKKIDSVEIEKAKKLDSNTILSILKNGLTQIGYKVEVGKSGDDKIAVPVLYGLNGRPEKQFFADGYHKDEEIVLEVEAAAAVANNRFLKDLFEACVMDNVKYCIIAVRNVNKTTKNQKDFEAVLRFIDTIYASQKLTIPLNGVLIIGY